MKKVELVLLSAILLVSLLLSFSLLTRGHDWGDDFAAYLMQSRSLLQGNPEEFVTRNAFTIQNSSYNLGPVAYPWGYPALLAPVLWVKGLHPLALKLVNTVFYFLFLVVFYRLIRPRLGLSASLAATAVLAFNPTLLLEHDYILSDIPFLFFSTFTLFLIDRFVARAENRLSLPASLCIGLSVFLSFAMRTNGLLLLGPLALAHFIRWRASDRMRIEWGPAFSAYLVFGLLVLVQALILPGGQESHFKLYSLLTPQLLLENLVYYLGLPAGMFEGIPFGGLFFALTVVFFLAGMIAHPRRNAVFLAYILLTLVLYISWPERQGIRFLFPILPLILSIAAEGGRFAVEKLPAEKRPLARRAGLGLAGTLAALSLFVSAGSGWINLQNGRQINGPFDPVSAQMFEFVRTQTPPDSVMIFFKPRALRLFTDRDAIMIDNCEGIRGGSYVVFHEKRGGNGQVAEPEACTEVSLTVVFNNQRFTVYRVTP